MKLYEIVANYQRILDKDELTLEDEEFLQLAREDIERFAIQSAAHIKNLEAEHVAVATAIANMREREDKLSEKIDKRYDFLIKFLKLNNIERITSHPDFIIKIRKGREKVHVYDNEKILDGYYKQRITDVISLELIAEDIKKGIDVPGARMIREDKVEIK